MTSATVDPHGLARNALELLTTRYSVGPKYLTAPGPSDEQLQVAFAAALRAPDHDKLIPFRFVVVRDDGLERLAKLFVDYGRRCGKSEVELAEEHTRAVQAPVVIAVIARIDSAAGIPAHEQWITVGGALTGVLTALHFMGFGAKMLSGKRAADPTIVAAFCREGETLAGWISTGTPKTALHRRGTDDVEGLVARF